MDKYKAQFDKDCAFLTPRGPNDKIAYAEWGCEWWCWLESGRESSYHNKGINHTLHDCRYNDVSCAGDHYGKISTLNRKCDRCGKELEAYWLTVMMMKIGHDIDE